MIDSTVMEPGYGGVEPPGELIQAPTPAIVSELNLAPALVLELTHTPAIVPLLCLPHQREATLHQWANSVLKQF